MTELMASKGHTRRSAQVSALALVVAALATSAPNAVAATLGRPLTWTAQRPIPTARGCLASAVLNGNIYVVGGFTGGEGSTLNKAEAYRPQTKHWSTLAPMPTSRSCLAATSLDGRIYAIGGDSVSDNLTTVESYSPASGKWKTDAPVPAATAGDYAAVAGAGHIYAVDDAGDLEIYNPKTNRWTPGRSIPTTTDLPGVAWSGNRLYVIGGLNGFGTPLGNVQAYDPETNTWQKRAPVLTPRSHPAVGTLDDGQIIVAGGGPPPSSETTDVELYTPSSNTWHKLTALPVATIPTGAAVGRMFYVISGFVAGTNVTRSVWAAVVQ